MKYTTTIYSLLLFVTSCANEIKPLAFETETITKNFEASIEISFDKVKDKSNAAQLINKEIEKQIIYAIPNSEKRMTLEEAINGFDLDYITFKDTFEEQSEPWMLIIETELMFQSEELITIGISSYSNTGGAHGNDMIRLLNFNPLTGQLLPFDAIIKNKDEFERLAEGYFKKAMIKDELTTNDFFFGDPFHLPENFGFSDDGLILLYNTYEIASYNQGYTEFTIPFKNVADYLKINLHTF